MNVNLRIRFTVRDGFAGEQDFGGPLESVLERIAILASVVPKEATWEGIVLRG